MEYLATELQSIKSYPTYQFHAFTSNNQLSSDNIFKICILETLKWLRLRLKHYESLPSELLAPEPDSYDSFSSDQLASFNINIGAAIDCTYIPDHGVWSLKITEPDIGENIGTDTERLPVNGRTFRTEVSFRMHSSDVEVGVRTTCSEPADCCKPCTVFRPAVVRELANNPYVGFIIEGFRLNGKPITIINKAEIRNLERLLDSSAFNMPIAIIGDSRYTNSEPPQITLPEKNTLSFIGFDSNDFTKGLTVDTSKVKIENSAVRVGDNKSRNHPAKTVSFDAKSADETLPVFDYKKLAEKTMGFAVVCFVADNCFEAIKNKLGISITSNEIIVLSNKEEVERVRYSDKTVSSLYNRLKNELRDMLKRSSFAYGNILFYSDARLTELRERRHHNISLEDKLHLYKQENSELKAHNRELSQQNTDLQLGIENARVLNKQLKRLTEENDALKLYINNIRSESASKENAYHKAAELINFYRQKAFDSAEFPTNKDIVCNWARKNFMENIVISPRAESALKKYSGALDTAILCDGIYYLNAYARYRKAEITSDTLSLYAESYNWDVSGCGASTLRTHREEYEIIIDGEKHLLDSHIKYGVNSQVLLRIYFCWDESKRRIIIGYMPDHLATYTQHT